MQKATNIFGGIASVFIITAVIFKFQGIVGGNIFLVFGAGLFLPVFLVLKGILVFKETKSPLPIIVSIVGVFYTLGILFLIQHYVGGMLIYLFSFYILIIILSCWYFIELFKKAETRSISLSTISLLLLFCALTFGFGNRVIGYSVKNGMVQNNNNIESIGVIINKMSTSHLEIDTSNAVSRNEFKKRTQQIIDKIEALKKDLALMANRGNPYNNLNEIQNITSSDINNMVLFDNRKADKLRELIYEDYYLFCLHLLNGTPLFHEIDNFVDINQEYKINDERIIWQDYYFYNMPVISSISYLSTLQVKIRLFENLVYKNFPKK